jgi:hypothetical protein
MKHRFIINPRGGLVVVVDVVVVVIDRVGVESSVVVVPDQKKLCHAGKRCS